MPGAQLLDIKVGARDGRSSHDLVARGIDEALDRAAQVLSISLGYNHRSASAGGHEWACPDGRCPLCTAVDNAATVGDEGRVVVVAAGNEENQPWYRSSPLPPR